jgi:hypothetical protein
MNRSLTIVLLTTVGFAAGIGSGIWIGRSHVACQPPPAWLYTEFANITRSGPPLQHLIQAHPGLWTQINAELSSIRPGIDEFKSKLNAIDEDFRTKLEAILSPAQREALTQAQVSRNIPKIYSKFKPATPAPAPAATPTPAKPATTQPEQAPRIPQERADGMVASFVFVPYTKARFVEALALNDEQAEQLGKLLDERRSRFLEVCDKTPPPSLQLNKIAALIRSVADKEKK